MEINDEIKKCFKDHKAHFRDLGEVQILDWKKDNTICQSIRYVFDGSKLYVSGDYGCAVFWLTWKGTPESFENDMSLGYFYEKMQAYEGDRKVFDDKKAKEDIEYHFEDLLEDYYSEKEDIEEEIEGIKDDIKNLDKNDESYADDLEYFQAELKDNKKELEELKDSVQHEPIFKLKEKILDLVDSVSSINEWTGAVDNSQELTSELSDYDYDYWEWIYGIGQIIPPRVELYLAGLQMAAEQLKESKVEQ
ncbi:MAG: hypothetical protein E6Z74_10165 [Clostridium perfringens]|nr:hypothetical protein [Clostridium butyricum]MDU5776278.1 hypothetical protein [Clostridium perfringens]